MSDVWQGPGWWLASDGKWYPADAKPGAVYEGDLTSSDDSSSAPADAAVVSSDVAQDAGAVITNVPTNVPVVTEPAAAAPGIPMAEIDALEVGAPDIVEPDVGIASAVPTMPEPVVESPGGWQTIEPAVDSASVPEPDVEAAAGVVDDGWTSAFEERAAGGDVLDDLPEVGAPTAPAIDLPEVPTADMPGISVPDVTVPDVTVPDVSVPDITAPDISVPDVAVPDVTAPGISVPDVAAPDITAPGISVPDVSVPDVAVPDVAVPNITTPDISVPDVAVPDIAVPDVTAPGISVPDVAAPDITAPDVALPDMAPPTIDAPDLAPPSIDVPDVSAAAAGAGLAASLSGVEKAEPIERSDAWRKPAIGDDAPKIETDPPRKPPEVVDLAIRDQVQDAPVEEPKRNGKMLLGVLAVLALIGLIAWLIAALFAGNSTTDTTDTTTSTVAVEDTTDETEAPETTEEDASSTTSEVDTSTDSPSSSEVASVFDLRAGDCIVGDIGAGQVTRVEKVDCELEHQFEVYREALIESSIVEFDEPAISAYAEDVCRTSLAAYIPADDDRNLKFKFLQPTEDSWNQAEDPDRVITCLLFDGDGDPLIGRAN